MSYIGNTNTTQAFTPAIDYFSGNASTTAFTLSKPVASVAQIQVVVNNVAQNPSSAYTVSSNTITFTSAPSAGTNNIYVYYTSPITQVIQPGQNTVFPSSLSTTNALYWDTSGNVGIGTTSPSPYGKLVTVTGDNATTFAAVGATNMLRVQGYNSTYVGTVLEAVNLAQSANTPLFINGSTIKFGISGTTQTTIDSSGNVGIGTSSPSSYGLLTVLSSTAGSAKISIQDISGGASPAPLLQFGVNSSNGFNTSDAARVWATSPSSTTAALNFAAYSGGAPSTAQMTLTGGNLQFNSGYGSVATAYGCRAWVNFNGVTTVSIRGSANVSSVTRASAGLYTINFTTAMPDVNYSAIGTCNFEYDIGLPLNTKTFATGSIGIETFRPYPYNTVVDVSTACVAIFR